MKSTTDTLKMLVAKIKEAIWTLGTRAFLLVLVLILIDLIFGGFVYYKYVFLAENKEVRVSESIIKFNENAYQQAVKELRAREQGEQELPTEEPLNP